MFCPPLAEFQKKCISRSLFSFSFWCLPHFWQFARHGDKISEKKEQNVRMENAFVSVIMVVFKFVLFFFGTHFNHKGE